MQQGDTNFYAQSIRGAYQAFFDSNIQADFVSLDDIAQIQDRLSAVSGDAEAGDRRRSCERMWSKAER